ncbi:dipeptide/oligopeptide/nickel ABC transporter permease/ATP-binding protein [Kribbella sp. NPDC055071]
MIAGLRRRPIALIAIGYLIVVVGASVLAPLIAPYAEDEQDLAHVLSAPTAEHWLGTGVLGRDVLSQLLYGGKVTVLGGLIAGVLYIGVGVPLGLLAGYLGGWFEGLVLRLADLVYAVPVIVILLVVVAVFPDNETAAMVALGLLGAPGLARIVRSTTKGLREELYVRAAQVAGLRPLTIMRRHILPRLSGTIIVQLSLFSAGAVLLETGLGFLGVGSQRASWGALVAEASQNLGTQPWLLVPSGLLVITFILSLGLLGDAVRDTVAERYGGTRAIAVRQRSSTGAKQVPSATSHREGALLSVRSLTVQYSDSPVISDVDLDLMPGEALGILGESGCGKTVTALSIMGLLRGDGRITAGSIRFDGIDLVTATPDQLRAIRGARIGWISQEPIVSLDPSFTVGSQVAEAVRTQTGCSRRQARRRAIELLGLVRLPDPRTVARAYPHQLSGGMAQRVGIAAALAGDPAVLIADEPTTALDVTIQAEILDLLRDLQGSGMAIILVTHDWGVLSDLCERAIVMYAGQVVEQAAVPDLIHRPRHPYTAGLVACDPHHATPGEPLKTIEGSVPETGHWPHGCRFSDRCPLVQADCREQPVELVMLDPTRQTRCLHNDELLAHDAELVRR